MVMGMASGFRCPQHLHFPTQGFLQGPYGSEELMTPGGQELVGNFIIPALLKDVSKAMYITLQKDKAGEWQPGFSAECLFSS